MLSAHSSKYLLSASDGGPLKDIYWEISVSGALQATNLCPRKRGLSDGLRWVENRIQRRALYKINVKRASNGYRPEETYKCKYTFYCS